MQRKTCVLMSAYRSERQIRPLIPELISNHGADGETRTPTAFATAPSRRRVYQFHHVDLPTALDCNRPRSCDRHDPLAYFGTSPVFEPAVDPGARGTGTTGTGAVRGEVGIWPGKVCDCAGSTGCVDTSLDITPLSSDFLLVTTVRPMLVVKNMTARTAVVRLMKLAEPEDPKTLPADPLPNAAPMSAPLPCCSNTRTMMLRAASTCNTRIRTSILLSPSLLVYICYRDAARQIAANSAATNAAPPIKPPSMSGMPNNCTAFDALTLPP